MARNVSLAAATGAPRSYVVGEREYFLSPLTLVQQGEYERWVKDQFVDLFRRNVANEPQEFREKVIADAINKASRLSAASDEMLAITTSSEAIGKMIRMGLMRRHPDISDEDILEIMEKPDLVSRMLAALAEFVADATRAQGNGQIKKKRKGTKAQKRKKERRH